MFKRCFCGAEWKTREDFLTDKETALIGYQVNFEVLEEGYFLFLHARSGCKTTLGLETKAVLDLYDGPIYEERKTGSAECPAYCLSKDNLMACPARCACAHIREVIQIIKAWPKNPD